MILTVASFKGGVAKTTTAIHLAAYLAEKSPALLIDGDPNRSATGWAARGELPYKVVDERQAARFAREFENVVIDTEARPDTDDLRALVGGCDLLIIPSTPDALAIEALMLMVHALRKIGSEQFRVLLTIIPPPPSRDAAEARSMLKEAGLPLFRGEIRRRVAFQKAALAGRLVSAVSDPRAAQAWDDYLRVGREILK